MLIQAKRVLTSRYSSLFNPVQDKKLGKSIPTELVENPKPRKLTKSNVNPKKEVGISWFGMLLSKILPQKQGMNCHEILTSMKIEEKTRLEEIRSTLRSVRPTYNSLVLALGRTYPSSRDLPQSIKIFLNEIRQITNLLECPREDGEINRNFLTPNNSSPAINELKTIIYSCNKMLETFEHDQQSLVNHIKIISLLRAYHIEDFKKIMRYEEEFQRQGNSDQLTRLLLDDSTILPKHELSLYLGGAQRSSDFTANLIHYILNGDYIEIHNNSFKLIQKLTSLNLAL